MRLPRSLLTAAIAALVLHQPLPAAAQQVQTQQAQPAPAINPEALAEARRMMQVTKVHAMMDQMVGQMLGMIGQALVQNNPGQQAEINQVLTELFLPEMRASLPEMLDEVAKVYTLHYSAEDLRQIIAFYETPVGRKTIEIMPIVMQQTMAMGQSWGQQTAMRVLQKHAETLRQRGIKNL